MSTESKFELSKADAQINDKLGEFVLGQIINSENSDNEYANLAVTPDHAQALLEFCELKVAKAGANLETGRRLKDEKISYEQGFADYETILSLAAQKLLDEHPELITREEAAKRDVVDFLIESKRRIIESDIHKRLEMSRYERLRENVSRSHRRIFLGSATILGVSGAATLGVVKAAEAVPEEFISEHGNVGLGTFVFLAILAGFRAGAGAGSNRLRQAGQNELTFYALGRSVPDQIEDGSHNGSNDRTEAEKVHERLARYHIALTRPKLTEIALDTNLSEDKDSKKGFVKGLIDSMEASLDKFYRMEDPNSINLSLRKRVRKKIQKIFR
jgi:hypothetical protein